ncbi:multidrug resistance-associated protein 4-like [Centruroides sculpturatus]|uniref:multidrug resistance-associated protein 4-like n=1 Tax=Centruroides sculpturatus TaxID=218467 RepID=UPI000C6E6F16|nr:multidrug resistance-associated protein 4-like [Centruroides sculpturatus]
MLLIQETVLVAGQAYFLGLTIHYLDSTQEFSPYNIYVALVGFFVITAIYVFTYTTSYFMTELYGMKLKVAFCSVIYKKAIKLSSSSLEKSNIGQMVNLLATDVSKFHNKINSIPYLFTNPFFIIVTIAMLWKYYGWTILVGFLAIFLFIPIQIAFSKLYSKLRLQAAILGDKRLNLLNEMIADMRLIKMYTWELPYAALIEKIRKNEMKKVRMFLCARELLQILGYPISKLCISLTYIAFFLNGGQLNAEIIFVTMAFFFYIFHKIFILCSTAVNLVAEIFVSLKRFQDFLLLQEKDSNAVTIATEAANLTKCGIWMKNVTAVWKKETEPTLNDISLSIKTGELLTVIGPVGSGKTSLLMSMLGEIPITSGKVSVKGKIAYASQEAWVFNETIKENILFGEEYQEDKYRKILHITALEKDISLFPKKDLTIVGERGVIMSGGQKARINLARALYLDADIFLLDDPLSAVDVPVAKHIFEKCITEYLKEKICILVTHQIQFLNSASKILVLNKGTCEFIGSCNEIKNFQMLTGILSEQEIVKNSIEVDTALFKEDEIIETIHSTMSDDIEDKNNSNEGCSLICGICVLQAILYPYILILTSFLSMIFYAFWTLFSRVLKSLKHIEGKSRSPVFSHLSVSLYGLTTIRAFHAENKFKSLFNKYQDKHTATWFLFVGLNRWMSLYGQIVCYINLIITVTIFTVSIDAEDAGSQIGLVINHGILIFLYFQNIIRNTSDVEFQMNSVKRILNYSKLKSEASYESLPNKRPPSNWPQRGEIHFDNVSLKYSKDKNIVLNNLTFRIRSGEKIGIVGRTGAGKDPMLFTGPLRRNIDPFNEYSEDQLWQALEQVQLKEVINKLPGGLDTHLSEGGRNFSVGERQLICLARTILRRNKILVMDEATSNIDKSTDSRIQKVIREKFKSCTVLTIAHRLHTVIDSDRVLVIDTGRLQEFDSPYALLKNVNGTFYNLIKNTGVTSMNELYKIAKNRYYLKESTEITKL